MDLSNLFILSPARRLQTFFGFPFFTTCAKPLSGRQMPVFEYQSDEERFTQCGNRTNDSRFCSRGCSSGCSRGWSNGVSHFAPCGGPNGGWCVDRCDRHYLSPFQ